MKVVVVGDGKVGYALTEQLSREGHDVVVIDNNAAALTDAINSLDVMGVVGNGATYSAQKEAGVDQADLLIAATSTDEVNLLCCMVAKKIGARHTIARVRNPEYAEQLQIMKDDLGLSMTINPELAAAREISRVLRFPSAIKIDMFAKGRVELVEVKLREGNPLIGLSLAEMRQKLGAHVLICAVQRGDELHIPSGEFRMRLGDKISLTGTPSDIASIFRTMGILKQRTRSVIIAGGGRIAYYLARQLLEMGMRVTIVELDRARAEHISELLPKAMVIQGDAMDQDLLLEEGLDEVDGFVALTGMDEENILMSMYAAKRGVGKVVAKVNKHSLLDILGESFSESIVSPKSITVNNILLYVRTMQNSLGSNVETLTRIVDGKVEALEFRARTASRVTDVPLKDLSIRKDVLIACIVRFGAVIIPGGADKISVGDSVIVLTTGKRLNDLNDILG